MSPSCLGGISGAGARSCFVDVDAPAFQFHVPDGDGGRGAPAALVLLRKMIARACPGFQTVHFTKG